MKGRYELKFLVTAAQRDGVLTACGERLRPDPYGAGGTYRVNSQYFDTPRLRWYWEKVEGVDPRRKVRLRWYGDATSAEALAEAAAFLEIKHRRGDQILKERVRLLPQAAAALLEDAELLRDLEPWTAPEADPGTRAQLVRDANLLNLQAINVISYRREAYLGQLEAGLRLTFDHAVQALRPGAWSQAPAGAGQALLPAGLLVMELKFDAGLPSWARSAIVSQSARLQRFSKYARGVEALRSTAAR